MDVPDEETLEDVNGVKRKTMHDTWAPPAPLGWGMVMVIHSGGLGHLSNNIDGIMGYSCGIREIYLDKIDHDLMSRHHWNDGECIG